MYTYFLAPFGLPEQRSKSRKFPLDSNHVLFSLRKGEKLVEIKGKSENLSLRGVYRKTNNTRNTIYQKSPFIPLQLKYIVSDPPQCLFIPFRTHILNFKHKRVLKGGFLVQLIPSQIQHGHFSTFWKTPLKDLPVKINFLFVQKFHLF